MILNMNIDKNYEKMICDRIFLTSLSECEYFPKYFTIETCNNCNAKCIMCPKSRGSINQLEIMSENLFEKIILQLIPYKNWIEMICLNSDGEPTLDPLLSERIYKLKSIGIKKVNISTNAQLLTEGLSKKLIRSGLDDIRISIDSIKEDTYKKIRRGLDFNKVINNVKQLISIRNKELSNMEIRIRMVELEENRNERNEWYTYWQELLTKKDKIQIMPAHSWSNTIKEETNEKISYYSNIPCISVFSSMAINFDGNVQLCDSDINQSIILGNVDEQIEGNIIKEIWNSDKFKTIRQFHLTGKRNKIKICKGCDHWSREFKQMESENLK